MTATDLVYSPYHYEIHEDPYPTYQRLRDEAPVYRNDERRLLGAVPPRRRGGGVPRQRALLVGPRRVARPGRVGARTPTARCRSSPWTRRCTAACAALVSRGFTPRRVAELEPRIRELTREHLDVALAKGAFDFIGDLAGKLPMDVICELHRRARRPTATSCGACPTCSSTARRAWTTCRPPASRRPSRWSTYYADMLAQRRADPPTTSPRRCSRPRSTATGSPTTRSWASCSSWSSPATRPPPSCSATPGTGPGATPTSGPSPSPTRPHPRLGRGDAALRHVEPDARPHHHRATSSCTAPSIPAGDRVRAARRLGQPRRARLRRARPRTTSTAPSSELQQIASFGFGRHFCLGASLARLEARVCLEELVRTRRRLRVDPAGIRRVHSRQRPRLRRPPHHGGRPLMPRFDAASRAPRRPSSPARRRASARRPRCAGRGRPPRRARRPAARPARGDGGGDRGRRRRGAGAAARPHRRRLDRRLRRSRPRPSSARSRSSCRTPATCCPATALGVDPDDFARQVQVNLLGAHRLVRRLGPAMVERRRGDIVFVTSDVVRVPRTYMAAYVDVQVRPRGPGPRHADGAGGHRRARRHRAPRPVDHRAGHHLERGRPSTRSSPTGSAGASSATRRAPARPGRRPRRSHAVVSTPRGTHLTLVEVEPEAPVGGTA